MSPVARRLPFVIVVLLAASWWVLRGPNPDAPSPPGDSKQRPDASTAPPAPPSLGVAASPDGATATERRASDVVTIDVRMNGAPLADVTLYALEWDDDVAALAARSVGLPESVRSAAHRATSDATGRATLSLGPARSHLVVGRGPGSAPGVVLLPTGETSAVLRLLPEQRIHGTVWTWPEKTRLAGAHVRARRAFQAEVVQADRFDPIDRVAGMFFTSTTESAGDGGYVLGGLPPGRVFVLATAEGRAATFVVDRILPHDAPISLSLIAGSTISGTVVDAADGRPLEGASVFSISRALGETGWESDHVHSAHDGRFRVVAPLDGENEFGVRVHLDGYAKETRIVDPGRERHVSVRLRRARRQEVLLRDADGRPIPGGWISVVAVPSGDFLALGRTDEGGTLRCSLADDVRCNVHARADAPGERVCSPSGGSASARTCSRSTPREPCRSVRS